MMPMIFNEVDVNSRLSHRGKYPDVRGRASHSVQQCLSSLAVQKLSCPPSMLANAKCFAKVRKMCAGIIQSSRTEFVDLIERESDFSTTETRSPLQMTLADNGAKLGQQSTGRLYFGATLGRILTRTINAGAGIRSNPLAVVLAASKRALSWSGKQYPTFMT